MVEFCHLWMVPLCCFRLMAVTKDARDEKHSKLFIIIISTALKSSGKGGSVAEWFRVLV